MITQLAKDKRLKDECQDWVTGALPDVVEKELAAPNTQGGKPVRRMTLESEDDYTIMKRYQVEYRGLVQYYQ